MNIRIQITFKVDGYIYYLKNIKTYVVLGTMTNLFIVGEVQKSKTF